MASQIDSGQALPSRSDLAGEERWTLRALQIDNAQLALPFPPASDTPSAITISQRLEGGKSHSKGLSITSLSSIYSDTPGISQRFSKESVYLQNSLTSAELEDLKNIPLQQLVDYDLIHPHQAAERRSHSGSFSSTQSTSSRPEIWKRRSPKGSISIPDLKLGNSSGLTNQSLAVQQTSPILIYCRRKSISFIEQLARKPVAARVSPPQLGSMGVKASRLSKLKNKVLRSGKDEAIDIKSPKSESHSDSLISPISRPPTPEYEKDDPQPQISHQVLSPVSPATPPYLPPIKSSFEEHNPLEVPPYVEYQSTARRAASTPNLLLSKLCEEPNDDLNETDEPLRSQLHKKAVSQVLTSGSPPSPLSRIRPPLLRAQTIARIFHPRSTVLPGTIFPAPQLTVVQLDCYQGHRAIRSSKNDVYPLSCGICEKQDNEKRWMCLWCYLRCCDKCMQVLSSSPKRDLRHCLHKIGRPDRISDIEGNEHLHFALE